ncbi:hypothetical protein C8R44DRAFT_115449 [Mycena epipterygia]|nr:hypothetical protein C8R44DRAFT_115449 [Mycena epipterygia]
MCEWSTGPRALLQSPITTSPIPIEVLVADLPRGQITVETSQALMARWAELGGWSDSIKASVLAALALSPLDAQKGACHCEAGLILLRAKSKEVTAIETPKVLKEMLKALGDKNINGQSAFTIGVAKKCCPLCRHLGELLQKTYKLRFDLPGRHSVYRPWVPPAWLPTDILEDLETKMLEVIEKMVAKHDHLRSSRVSSPGSDPSVDAPMGSRRQRVLDNMSIPNL